MLNKSLLLINNYNDNDNDTIIISGASPNNTTQTKYFGYKKDDYGSIKNIPYWIVGTNVVYLSGYYTVQVKYKFSTIKRMQIILKELNSNTLSDDFRLTINIYSKEGSTYYNVAKDIRFTNTALTNNFASDYYFSDSSKAPYHLRFLDQSPSGFL